MGLPITGSFNRAYNAPGNIPYATAAKWGTGINPVHGLYQGPPRPFGPGVPNDLDQRTRPSVAAPDEIEFGPPWGAPDDPSYLDAVASEFDAVAGVPIYTDDYPGWQEDTSEFRADTPDDMVRPWGVRGIPSGLHHEDAGPNLDGWSEAGQDGSGLPQTPTETVSEGWENKATEGAPPDSETADDSQVFVQTSDVQRYRTQNNDRAQLRGTDDPRTAISSRVKSKVVKVYSGGLRHYDMFPYQIDDMPRGFRYRTAALGPSPYLAVNEMKLVSPLQRTPPPDPSLGIPTDDQADNTGNYGYTPEDQGWW